MGGLRFQETASPAVPEGERQGGAQQTAVKGCDGESRIAALSVEVRLLSNGRPSQSL